MNQRRLGLHFPRTSTLGIKAWRVMSMASVHAGSFDIENEKLVFRAAGKPDEFLSGKWRNLMKWPKNKS